MNKIVLDILLLIDDNLYEDISINDIAVKLVYDKFYIMKVFKKELGISIITYINYLKILNSLNKYNDDESILKIALYNGFNSLEYYSEVFKSFLGVSPITYKKYISGEILDVKTMETLRNSLYNLNNYKEFIMGYRNGISIDKEKGTQLVLYKDINKKVAA